MFWPTLQIVGLSSDSVVLSLLTVTFVPRSPFISLSHFDTLFPARCFNEESCLSLKQLEGYLVVLQPDAPQISLSGVGPHLARPAPEFEGPRGVPLFPELRIVCSLSHAVNTAAQGMEGGGQSSMKWLQILTDLSHFCWLILFICHSSPALSIIS